MTDSEAQAGNTRDEGGLVVRRRELAGKHTSLSQGAGISAASANPCQAEMQGQWNQIIPLFQKKPEVQIVCDGSNF